MKDSTGSESDGGDSISLRSETGSLSSTSEIQPKKVRGFGFGDIFKDQPIKLRPRSMDMENEAEKVNFFILSFPWIIISRVNICRWLKFQMVLNGRQNLVRGSQVISDRDPRARV